MGRAEWDYVVAELGPAKVLRKVERTLLAGYCEAVSRALRATKRAREDASQEPRAEKAWDQVRKFAAVFGIGPAERSRVQPAPSEAQSEEEKYFFEPR